MSEPTILDMDQISRIYHRLLEMSVQLDPDPLAHGPEKINIKTAATQNMLSELERILTQIVFEHHILSRQTLTLEKQLDLQVKDHIANNPEVSSGASFKDRQARAQMLLSEEFELLNEKQVALRDMEILTDVLKTKRSELRNLQQRLKDQFRICQEEIGLGARWRDPRTSLVELTPGFTADSSSYGVLNSAVSAAVKQLNEESSNSETEPQPKSVSSLIEEDGTGVAASEMDSFLEDVEEAVKSPDPEEVDIDSLLEMELDLDP